MFYDSEHLRALRTEAERHAIDFSRARLEPDANGGYVIHFTPPLVSLDETFKAPAAIESRTAGQAEGEMLSWLLKIQIAERQRVRTGRVYGRDSSWVNRTPLSTDELSEYKADLSHQAKLSQLQAELAAVIETAALRAKADGSAAELRERYGMTTAKPDTAKHASTTVPRTAGNGVRQRKTKIRGN